MQWRAETQKFGMAINLESFLPTKMPYPLRENSRVRVRNRGERASGSVSLYFKTFFYWYGNCPNCPAVGPPLIPWRDESKKLTLLRLFLYWHFQFSLNVFGSQGGGPLWVEFRSIFWRRYHSERWLDPKTSKLKLPSSYRKRKDSLLQWHPWMVSIWQYSGILILDNWIPSRTDLQQLYTEVRTWEWSHNSRSFLMLYLCLHLPRSFSPSLSLSFHSHLVYSRSRDAVPKREPSVLIWKVETYDFHWLQVAKKVSAHLKHRSCSLLTQDRCQHF